MDIISYLDNHCIFCDTKFSDTMHTNNMQKVVDTNNNEVKDLEPCPKTEFFKAKFEAYLQISNLEMSSVSYPMFVKLIHKPSGTSALKKLWKPLPNKGKDKFNIKKVINGIE